MHFGSAFSRIPVVVLGIDVEGSPVAVGFEVLFGERVAPGEAESFAPGAEVAGQCSYGCRLKPEGEAQWFLNAGSTVNDVEPEGDDSVPAVNFNRGNIVAFVPALVVLGEPGKSPLIIAEKDVRNEASAKRFVSEAIMTIACEDDTLAKESVLRSPAEVSGSRPESKEVGVGGVERYFELEGVEFCGGCGQRALHLHQPVELGGYARDELPPIGCKFPFGDGVSWGD